MSSVPIATFLLLAASTIPASAPAASIARAMPVSYSDLDLSTPAGRKQLDRRVDRAAREVCYLNSASDRATHNAAKACHVATMKEIAAEVAAAEAAPKAGAEATIMVRSR